MEYIEDPTITPEIAQHHCKEIGDALRKIHTIPLYKERGESFEKVNQKRWNDIQIQASQHATDLSVSLIQIGKKAMQIFAEWMKSLAELHSSLQTNIHTDLHPRNLFWTNRGLLIIDWESSSHGHPYFDLASLAIFLGFDETQEKELLSGYFRCFPTPEELHEYTYLKKYVGPIPPSSTRCGLIGY